MCYDLLETFLVQLMGCNADDGAACGLAGTAEMREAFLGACKDYHAAHPSGPESAFAGFLRNACLGEADLPLAPARPAAPPFSRLTHEPLDVDEVSTVVPMATFLRLMSSDDKRRFERKFGVRFTATGATDGTDFLVKSEDTLIRRLGNVPTEHRHFQFSADQTHGRPFVWVTPKSDLERVLREPGRRAHTPATIARDFLGLVHHGPQAWGGSGANHLVALHIPARVVAEAGYMRPSTLQAFVNRRFVQRFGVDDLNDHSHWGRALDLYLFATSQTVAPIGGRERVLLRLQRDLLKQDVIRFDYLDAVSNLRGDTPNRDDDQAFLRLVKGDRDAHRLALEICQ